MNRGFEKKKVDRIEPGLNGMNELLRRCGIELSDFQLALLWKFHQFLRARNPELNLTRIHNFTNIVYKHYVDSMYPALLTQLPSPLLDLGSGAGFPGIPLKIYQPDLKVILAESRGKRVDFLASVVKELGLEGVEIVGKKISSAYTASVPGIISRAVLSIPDTLEIVKNCLTPGGLVVLMKGPGCTDECTEAQERFKHDFDLIEDRAYSIPGTTHRRRLIIFKRKGLASSMLLNNEPAVRNVESSDNPTFKFLNKLGNSRGIKKTGRTLVSGEKLVEEMVDKHPDLCEMWMTTKTMPFHRRLPSHVERIELSPRLFQALDSFGTGFPMICAVVPLMTPWQPEEGFPRGCSVLVPFQDPENIGAVIRSAAAFGASQVIVTAEGANPFHPKAVRASAGAVFTVRLRSGVFITDIPPDLPLVALSAEGEDIRNVTFPDAFGLLVGAEGPGLPEKFRKHAVGFATARGMESLNAAVAASLALYEWAGRKGRRGASG
jgi:16S rRNA (guanine(527)-N(7))-methyltransferase RsmG